MEREKGGKDTKREEERKVGREGEKKEDTV